MAFGSAVKKLYVELGLRTQGYLSKLKGSETATKRTTDKIGNSFKSMARRVGAAFGGMAIAKFFKDATKAASDFQESHSKLMTVFKNETDGATQAVNGLRESYGLSAKEATVMLGATGDLLTGLGMTERQALALSQKTQQLAVDLASFTNYSGGAKGASDALTKAMLGERESAKQLGIVIQEKMVQERLAAEGKDKLTGSSLLAAKAEVTLKLAMEQSKNALGDYARTKDSFANTVRKVESSFDDMLVTVGDGIVKNEGFTSSLRILTETLNDPAFQQGLAEMAGQLAKIAGYAIQVITLFPQLIGTTKNLNRATADIHNQYTIFTDRMRRFIGVAKDTDGTLDGLKEHFDSIVQSELSASDKTKELTFVMKALATGGYGGALAEQFKKWRKEQAATVQETEKQIKQGPKLEHALAGTGRAIDKKTRALEKETKATEKDTDAT